MIKFSKCLFLSLILMNVYSESYSQNINISGWILPTISKEQPDSWMGRDPIVGRLACPPLTRLNLQSNSSELLMFSGLKQSSNEGKDIWSYTLKDGLYWWNNDQVKGEDIKKFLEDHLNDIVKQQFKDLVVIPKFQIMLQGKDIQITWLQKPKFGPYFLNDISFWRKLPSKTSKLSYECAGTYKLSIEENLDITLESQVKYGMAKQTIKIAKSSSPQNDRKDLKGSKQLDFKSANLYESKPDLRSPLQPIQCKFPIEMPIMTVLSWNPDSKIMKNPLMRKALTQIIPRGNVLRAASGFMGDLSSTIIPRSHPGYDQTLKILPYDLKNASDVMSRLGYKRSDPKLFRKSIDGQQMKLRLGIHKVSESLIKKIISDSLYFMGIGIEFVEWNGDKILKNQLDGVLTGVYLPWPHMSYLPVFHSKSTDETIFFKFTHKNLDKDLENYALTLSTDKPNWKILNKIHKTFYDFEPISIILQHSACLEGGEGINLSGIKNDLKDPDWFRKIIYQNNR